MQTHAILTRTVSTQLGHSSVDARKGLNLILSQNVKVMLYILAKFKVKINNCRKANHYVQTLL